MNIDNQVYTVSYLKRKFNCAEFEFKKEGNPILERGSILHSILEVGVDKYDKKGSTYRGTFRPYQFTHNFEELEAIANMVINNHTDLFTDKWKTEVQFDGKTSKNHLISGIVDTMSISGSSASLIDWKSGTSRANVTNELDMLQSIMYAYLTFQKYPYLTDVKFTYFYIEADEHLATNFSSTDIPKLELIIEKYIALAQYSGLKTNSQCGYCNNAGTCPLIAKNLTLLNSLDMRELKHTEKAIKSQKEKIKSAWLKEEAKKETHFTQTTNYYIKKDDLNKTQLCCCLKEDIKVSKAIANKFKEEGICVVEQTGYRVKPSAN